jgi:hypothetical protein
MAVSSGYYRDPARQNRSGIVHMTGKFVTSTSGTLVAASSDSPGFTLTKVGSEAGRYTVQFIDNDGTACAWLSIEDFRATILGAVADTAYTTTKALHAFLRLGTPALTTVASAGTVLVQFVDKALADAEVEDGAGFILSFDLKRSTASP